MFATSQQHITNQIWYINECHEKDKEKQKIESNGSTESKYAHIFTWKQASKVKANRRKYIEWKPITNFFLIQKTYCLFSLHIIQNKKDKTMHKKNKCTINVWSDKQKANTFTKYTCKAYYERLRKYIEWCLLFASLRWHWHWTTIYSTAKDLRIVYEWCIALLKFHLFTHLTCAVLQILAI